MIKQNMKFQKGDKIIFLGLPKDLSPSWARWTEKDGLIEGGEYIAKDSGYDPNIEGCKYAYHGSWFSLKQPDCIIVILRRPSDGVTIDKYLKSKGVDLSNVSWRRDRSRVRIIHLTGGYNGECTYSGPTTFGVKVSDSIARAKGFAKSYFGHSEMIVLKTKPSVWKVIEKISRYL